MYCFFCGREIKGPAKFCPYCGKSCEISSSSSEVNAVDVDDDWDDAPIGPKPKHGLSKVLRVLVPVCAVAAILAVVGFFVVPKIIGNDIEEDSAEEYVNETEQALEYTELDVLQIYKDAASAMEGQSFSFYEECSYNHYVGSNIADDSVTVSSVSVADIVDNNESTMWMFGTYSGNMEYSDDMEDAINYNFYYADGVYYTSDTTSDCKHCGRQVQPSQPNGSVSPGMTGMKWGNNNGPVQTRETSSRIHTRMVISLVLLGIAALIFGIAAIGEYRSCYSALRWFDDDDILIALMIYFIPPFIVVCNTVVAIIEFYRKKMCLKDYVIRAAV